MSLNLDLPVKIFYGITIIRNLQDMSVRNFAQKRYFQTVPSPAALYSKKKKKTAT